MVKLRLKRLGDKFNACYKIVAADERAPRDGKFIEAIGQYRPHSKEFVIDEALAQKWVNNGAQMTITVKNLFKAHKLYEKLMKNKTSNQVAEVKAPKTKKETKVAKKPAVKKETAKKPAAKKATK